MTKADEKLSVDAQSLSPRHGAQLPKCGVIMPISATGNRSEQYWLNVQRLLHRVIGEAGFDAINVWTNEQTDRVSERIIGNIYFHEITVADISDLNPNVMFELGLRLASKKPTVVIANAGGSIPFDIHDFHILTYPSDLNILDMEEFFRNISESLQNKYNAYKSGSYVPFLNHVVVDVLSPETREVPLDRLILDRLDTLGGRLARIEGRNSRTPTYQPSHWDEDTVVYVDLKGISDELAVAVESRLDSIPSVVAFPQNKGGPYTRFRLELIEAVRASKVKSAVLECAERFGIEESNVRFIVRE